MIKPKRFKWVSCKGALDCDRHALIWNGSIWMEPLTGNEATAVIGEITEWEYLPDNYSPL
jgi:hypothetical protein